MDPTAIKSHAAAPRAGAAAGKPHSHYAWPPIARCREQGEPVEVEKRIAVDQEEMRIEAIRGQRQGAGRSGRVCFNHGIDLHAADDTAAIGMCDILGPMSAKQQGSLDAVTAGFIQQVIEEWSSADVEHRLGLAGRQAVQSAAHPADQENRLFDAHAATTPLAVSQAARQSILSSKG